jgi:hypothetical protein
MNIDRLSPLLQRTTLLLSLVSGAFLLTACGGGSDNKSSTSSSSSSSSLRSSFSSASVPANGSGVWPSVKVEAQSPKVLSFEWSAVEGATYYKLFKHDHAIGGEVQLGGNLTELHASDEIGVHVHDWINNYYVVEACNADGCQRSNHAFTATEMLKAIGYLKASNTGAYDWFGWSIALSGDGLTLAVGAPAEDSRATGVNGDQQNNESTNSGAVYVFVKEDGLWVQQAYLKASNTEQPNINSGRYLPNDRFGYRVALSDDGNTLAVSALLEDSPSWGINCNQDNFEVRSSAPSSSGVGDLLTAQSTDLGAVYVFTRTGTEWEQEAYVKPLYSTVHIQSGVALRFGSALALSGDGKTLAIGTPQDSMSRSGVLMFSSSSSLECLEFYPSSSSQSSTSSTSSSISSSSSSSSSNSSSSSYRGGSNSGAVYTFRKGENGWVEEAHIKASNAEQDDAFGTSVALSTDGNTLVVGATGENSNATGVNGSQSANSCFYFKDEVYLIDADCKEASRHQVRDNLRNGAAYVFQFANQAWAQEAYIKPSSTYLQTAFGSSIDISGDGSTLVVGAPGDASKSTSINGDETQDIEFANTGAAYVFSKSGSSWAQQAVIKPSTLTKHDGISLVSLSSTYAIYTIRVNGGGEFGSTVSLSQNGDLLAVGTFRDSSNAKGINGDQGDTSALRAGAVYMFERNNTVWSQKSYVKAPNPDADDRFGLNVKLSGSGDTLAVGAHRESGRGYASAATSSGASSSAASSTGELDQNDNSLENSGAVYIY